jgi:hypothetical protein
MILESAQMLSTAHHILDGDKPGLYKPTHKNHPSNIWVRQSKANYHWLFQLYSELQSEYNYRYQKHHKSGELSDKLGVFPLNLKDGLFMAPPSCMPKEYIISRDSIVNYRNYYNGAKKHLHSWKHRPVPEWINNI